MEEIKVRHLSPMSVLIVGLGLLVVPPLQAETKPNLVLRNEFFARAGLRQALPRHGG